MLRKLRGLMGIGLAWGTLWAAITAVIGMIIGVIDPDSPAATKAARPL